MNEINMTGLLLQLADRGVTGVKVQYEGSGDSGAIENVVYTTEKMVEGNGGVIPSFFYKY